MSGIANIFSTIDSAKRVLGDRLSGGIVADVQKTLGRAKEDAQQFRDTQRAGGPAAEAAMLSMAMNVMPGLAGKILFHGGPQAVTKVNPELGQNLAKGPGFYLSNILNTPLNFATKSGKQSGVISAFDLPDADYAKLLRINDNPISKYPELEPQIAKLMQDVPALRTAAINQIKFMREAYPAMPTDKIITGEWIDDKLTRMFSHTGTPVKLGEAGIPGKTWQYSHDRPAELASVIFPQYSNLLTPVAQLPVEPGIAGARAANIAMKAILGITK